MFSLELDFTRSGETVTDLELKESLLMPYFIKPLKTRLSIAVRRLTIGPSDDATDASSSRRGKVVLLRQIVRFCFRLSGKLPIILPEKCGLFNNVSRMLLR